MGGAIITGNGSYVPERVITNRLLEKIVDTTDEWIVSHTGMRERRMAAPEQNTSDLGTEAAREALADAGITPDDVDLIICGTVTPDMIFPATASIIQANLGAHHCGAFDMSAGCTGFVYALAMASNCVRSGDFRHVLVINADCLTRITNWTDRTTCVLFGDAAGAVVVEPGPADTGILAYELVSMGEVRDMLTIPAGGSQQRLNTDLLARHQDRLHMNGPELFKVAVRLVPEIAERVVAKAGLALGDVDMVIMHQANQRIIDAAARRLDIAPERVVSIVEDYGNTSASSMPLAMDMMYRQGRLQPGDNVLVVGFGAGFTLGGALVRWTKPVPPLATTTI
ncbi:MAG TPA: beta-ketoacyl-ACP synthase III [Armatimonadota bacterium]|jgi:3-oxoacyl-[acyl-carrier-protein] synthase-3